jgi:hypothetical protein
VKKLKKILNYSLELISFTINYPDTYLLPLRTLLNKNKAIYIKYIDGILTDSEREFVRFLRFESNILESKYQQFFELKNDINNIKNNVKNSIREFFKFIKANNYVPTKTKLSKTFLLFDHNEKNILVSEKKKTTKFKVYPRSMVESSRNLETENNKREKLSPDVYRILINKSFYLFTIVKCIKIIFTFEQNKAKLDITTKITKIDIEEEIYDDILKLFYYYTENNPDNCMIILTSDFAFTFNSIDKGKFEKLMIFYISCLKTLRKNNYKFSTNATIFSIIKNIISDLEVRFPV